MPLSWYAVQTQPRKEFLAKQHLENQGFVTFLPATRRAVRHARKIEERTLAYFPGYLFVAKDETHWRSINGTRGVRRLIMAGDLPAEAPVGLIETLQSYTDAAGLLAYTGPLNPGDRVRIEGGPFADLVGSIHALKGDDRVAVLLDLMSTQIAVDVDRKVVMPTGID